MTMRECNCATASCGQRGGVRRGCGCFCHHAEPLTPAEVSSLRQDVLESVESGAGLQDHFAYEVPRLLATIAQLEHDLRGKAHAFEISKEHFARAIAQRNEARAEIDQLRNGDGLEFLMVCRANAQRDAALARVAELEAAQDPKPIGKCRWCGAPQYTREGFCGSCRQ